MVGSYVPVSSSFNPHLLTSSACARPFFEEIALNLANPARPGSSTKIRISASGARTKPYIKSLTVNGSPISKPLIMHADLFASDDVDIVFEMSEKIEEWGNEAEILEAMGVRAAWMGEGRVQDETPVVSRGDDL